MTSTAQWARTAPGRYEWQAPSGRIHQILRGVGADWSIVTSDGALTGRGFGSLRTAKAYCQEWENRGKGRQTMDQDVRGAAAFGGGAKGVSEEI